MKEAYDAGVRQALVDYGIMKTAKTTGDVSREQGTLETFGDYAAPVAGAVSPLAGGVVSGLTAPRDKLFHAATGLGGGTGGAALGGMAGLGLGLTGLTLAELLGADLDPETNKAALLASIGLGAVGGAGYGTHWIRDRLKTLNPENNRGLKTAEITGEDAVAALSGIPGAGIVGPIAAGIAAPKDRGWSRFGHTLGGSVGGGLSAATLAMLLGTRNPRALLGTAALGSGAGGVLGHSVSRENDPLLTKLLG